MLGSMEPVVAITSDLNLAIFLGQINLRGKIFGQFSLGTFNRDMISLDLYSYPFRKRNR